MTSEQPREHYRYGRGIEVCIEDGCKFCADIDFIRWIDNVRRNLVVDCGWDLNAALNICEGSWREMFDMGLSVEEAIWDELTDA